MFLIRSQLFGSSEGIGRSSNIVDGAASVGSATAAAKSRGTVQDIVQIVSAFVRSKVFALVLIC